MKNLDVIIFLVVMSFTSCILKGNNEDRFDEQLSKANSLYENGEYQSAIEIYDSLLKNDSLIGEIYFKRGYCKAQIFDPKTSKKDFEKAIQLNYKVKDAYLNLGVVECFYNDSLAVEYFDIVLEIDPANAKAKGYRKEALGRLTKLKTVEL